MKDPKRANAVSRSRVWLGASAPAAIAAVVALLVPTSLQADGATASISPKGGLYEGQTTQGRKCEYGADLRCAVTFKVQNGVVKKATFEMHFAHCTSKFFLYESAVVDDSGRFSITGSTSSIRGRFVARGKVKGSVYGSSSSCGAKTVSFTATRK